MKKPARITVEDFEPHPENADSVARLVQINKRTGFRLTPKGRVWSVTTQRFSDADVEILFGLDSLIEFNTHHISVRNGKLTHRGFARLCEHPCLQAFQDFRNNCLGDNAAKSLGSSRKIRWINLPNCGITDQGVRSIRNAKQLLRLSLNGNAITSQSIEHLASLKELRKLFIAGTHIQVSDAILLQHSLKRCEIDILTEN